MDSPGDLRAFGALGPSRPWKTTRWKWPPPAELAEDDKEEEEKQIQHEDFGPMIVEGDIAVDPEEVRRIN